MCDICKNPHTRAQALAKKRILKAEKKRIAKKIFNIEKIFIRKQVCDGYPRISCIARSMHTGKILSGTEDKDDNPDKYIRFEGFYNRIEDLKQIKRDYIQEKNIYYSLQRGKDLILYFPQMSLYYNKETNGDTVRLFSDSKIYILNPTSEMLTFLRKVGQEVSLN